MNCLINVSFLAYAHLISFQLFVVSASAPSDFTVRMNLFSLFLLLNIVLRIDLEKPRHAENHTSQVDDSRGRSTPNWL